MAIRDIFREYADVERDKARMLREGFQEAARSYRTGVQERAAALRLMTTKPTPQNAPKRENGGNMAMFAVVGIILALAVVAK